MIAVVAQVGQKLEKFANTGQSLIAILSDTVSNAVLNVKIVKSERQEKKLIDDNWGILNNIYINHLLASKTLAIGTPVLGSLVIGLMITLIFTGGIQVSMGYTTIGKFTTIAIILLGVIPDIMTLTSSISDFQELSGQLNFITNFLKNKKIVELGSETYSKQNEDVESLEFKNVTVLMNQKQLFKSISFKEILLNSCF